MRTRCGDAVPSGSRPFPPLGPAVGDEKRSRHERALAPSPSPTPRALPPFDPFLPPLLPLAQVLLFSLNQALYERLVAGDPAVLERCLPLGFALLAPVAAHEIGHVAAAKARGVEWGPPLLVPSLLTGACSRSPRARARALPDSRRCSRPLSSPERACESCRVTVESY